MYVNFLQYFSAVLTAKLQIRVIAIWSRIWTGHRLQLRLTSREERIHAMVGIALDPDTVKKNVADSHAVAIGDLKKNST